MAQAHPLPPPQRRRRGRGMSYAEQMRLEALMEYQRKLSEPVLLNNEVLISFASRMAAEMDFRPYKTMTTMYSKTFKADEFLLWAIRQEEVRDQTDALFLGNELVSRGVFLPVTYGAAGFPLLDADHQAREPDAQARGSDQAADRRRGARPGSEGTHRGGRHDRGRAQLTRGVGFRHADEQRRLKPP